MFKDFVIHDKIVGKKYVAVLDVGNKNESDCNVISYPNVIFDGNMFRMWYTGNDTKNNRIHYATSMDGLNWTKHGVVLDIGDINDKDAFQVDSPSIIYENSIFHMWYTGYDAHSRILYATSTDGKNWKKHGVVLDLGISYDKNNFDCDCGSLYNPSVVFDGKTYHMWYIGDDGYHFRVCYATSKNGINWDKHGIVLNIGNVGESDCGDIDSLSIIYDNKYYHMFYSGYDNKNWKLHYAVSRDGVKWKKYGVILPLDNDDVKYYENITGQTVIIHSGMLKMWYNGFNDTSDKFYYAELYPDDLKTALNIE